MKNFLVLNPQFQELDALVPGLLEEQLAWMKEDLSQNDRPWKIVLMHKDILSYNEYNLYAQKIGDLNDIAHDFMESFDALGIDLVLTGHMHTYRNRGTSTISSLPDTALSMHSAASAATPSYHEIHAHALRLGICQGVICDSEKLRVFPAAFDIARGCFVPLR